MIVAITSVLNEADIIEANLRHLLENGMDRILIAEGMSTDGTRDILDALVSEFPDYLVVKDFPADSFFQRDIMNYLSKRAGRLGADWVVPFDADEFVYAPGTGDIAAALLRVHADIDKLYLKPWLHLDWNRRVVTEHRLHKVVYRWQDGLTLEMGQHDVHGGPGRFATDVLDLREWKFRSYEHYRSKVALNIERLDPDLPANQATHYRELVGVSDQEMEQRWQTYMSQPTVDDPVPSSFVPSIVTT